MNLDQADGKQGVEVSDAVLEKMSEQFDQPNLKHGLEWDAMVEFAEKKLIKGAF
jgi:hypothetical protein